MALTLEEMMKKMGQDHVVPTEVTAPQPVEISTNTPIDQVSPGNIDVSQRTAFPNGDGSYRSLLSTSVDLGDKALLIPTVHPQTGEVLSQEKARKLYDDTGDHLGIYPNHDAATAASKKISGGQESIIPKNANGDTKGALIDASYSENPAEEGKRQQLADKLGIPAGLVTSESEAESFRMSNTVEDYEKNFPGLSKFMTRDPQNAKLVGREVDDLKKYEERSRGLKYDPSIGQKYGNWATDLAASLLIKGPLSLVQAGIGINSWITGGHFGKLMENLGYDPRDVHDFTQQFMSQGALDDQKFVAALGDKKWSDILSGVLSRPGYIANTVTEFLVPMGVGTRLTSSILQGTSKTMLKMAEQGDRGALKFSAISNSIAEGNITLGLMAEEVRRNTPGDTLNFQQWLLIGAAGLGTAGIARVMNGLANNMGYADIHTLMSGAGKNLDEVLKAADMPINGKLMRLSASGFGNAFEEFAQETQEQILQNIAEKKPWDEGVKHAAILGAVTGGAHAVGANVYPALRGVFNKKAIDERVQRARVFKAQSDNTIWGRLGELSADNSLRKKNPKKFEEWVETVVEENELPENIHVDAEVLQNAFNQNGVTPEELAQKSPELAEQLVSALSAKGEVSIKTSDYLVLFAGTAIGDSFIEDIRTTTDGLTFKESKTAMKEQQDIFEADIAKVVAENTPILTREEFEAQQVEVSNKEEKVSTLEDTGELKDKNGARKGDKQFNRDFKQLDENVSPEDKLNTLNSIERNVLAGGEITESEQQKAQEVRDSLTAEGYETPKLVGQKYNQGMKLSVRSSVIDETLPAGTEIITKVFKPQINKDGKMIQAAEVETTVGPEDTTETVAPVLPKQTYEEYLEENDPVAGFNAQVVSLREKVRGELKATGKYSDSVVDASIIPISNFYMVQAARENMTIEEVYKLNPLKISADGKSVGFSQPTKPAATLDSFKPENVLTLLDRSGWAVITGYSDANKTDKTGTKAEKNEQANIELEKDLIAEGFEYVKSEGVYQNGAAEPGFTIVGITPERAHELGNTYKQDSVQVPEGFWYHNEDREAATGVQTFKTEAEARVHGAKKGNGYTYIPSTELFKSGALYSMSFSGVRVPHKQTIKRDPNTGPGKRSREQDQAEIDADPRMSGDFREAVRRTPTLQGTAASIQPGDIESSIAHQEAVNATKPIHPYTSIEALTTDKAAKVALTKGKGQSKKKADKFGAPRNLPEGHQVGVRLDIPSYTNHGAWVVSIHEDTKGENVYDAGTVIGYDTVAVLDDVRLGVRPDAALKIARGSAKGTIATMKGRLRKSTPEAAKALAVAALNDYYDNPQSEWVQVGMDPERHGFFYDRETQVPVVAATEVIQVGAAVLARNVTYDNVTQLFQTDIRSGKVSLDELGLPKLPGKKKYKVREVATALQAYHRKLLDRKMKAAATRKGRELTQEESDTVLRNAIVTMMTDEVMFELDAEHNGAGWYTERYENALSMMSQIYPELATDKSARDAFTLLIGITSVGASPDVNLGIVTRIYSRFRKGGESEGTFTLAPGKKEKEDEFISKSLKRMNKLLKQKGGLDGLTEYLMREGKMGALKKEFNLKDVSGAGDYGADTKLPVAAVEVGAKVGVFYANLMGKPEYLTMDRWWSRTVNRYRGELLTAPTQQSMDRFKVLTNQPSLSNEEVVAAAKPYADAAKAKGFKGMTELETMSNSMWKKVTGTLDAPTGPTDRALMMRAAIGAQQKLARKGKIITIADIQALLWYYEKKLYGELGAQPSKLISFEEAAQAFLDKREAIEEKPENDDYRETTVFNQLRSIGSGLEEAFVEENLTSVKNLKVIEMVKNETGGKDPQLNINNLEIWLKKMSEDPQYRHLNIRKSELNVTGLLNFIATKKEGGTTRVLDEEGTKDAQKVENTRIKQSQRILRNAIGRLSTRFKAKDSTLGGANYEYLETLSTTELKVVLEDSWMGMSEDLESEGFSEAHWRVLDGPYEVPVVYKDVKANGRTHIPFDDVWAFIHNKNWSIEEKVLGEQTGVPKWSEYRVPGENTNYREILITMPIVGNVVKFKASGHYDGEQGENLLFHLRVDDRKGPNGEDIMFVNEWQTDWRKKLLWKFTSDGTVSQVGVKPTDKQIAGYRKELIKAQKKVDSILDARQEVVQPLMDRHTALKAEEEALPRRDPNNLDVEAQLKKAKIVEEMVALAKEINKPATAEDEESYAKAKIARNRVRGRLEAIDNPNTKFQESAPFLESDEAWLTLAMKILLRDAVEKGYDSIAWSTGDQQADIWSGAVRSSVDEIRWEKTKNGVHIVGFKGSDETPGYEGSNGTPRREVVNTHVEENLLSASIGKAMADQIRENPEQSGSIKGDELKVTKTGFAQLYDLTAASQMNKIAKELGSSEEVGEVSLSLFLSERESTRLKEQLTVIEFFSDSVPLAGSENGQFLIYDSLLGIYLNNAGEWITRESSNSPYFWATEEEAQKVVTEILDEERRASQQRQPGIKIDQSMRDAVIGSKLKLFSQPGPVEEPLAQYDPSTFTINLLKGANLSSVIHESGHFYLHAMSQIAAQENASETVKKDFQTIMDWFGVDANEWYGMSLKEQNDYHEQFAESFELFTMEGKAPNIELQGAFTRFRQWMISVYKDIESFLQTHPKAGKLNDEVRAVFGRMIASEESIAEAEKIRAYMPMFSSAEESGTSEAKFKEYIDQHNEATQEAVTELTSRSIRDMKWLSNAQDKALKALQSTAKKERDVIREQVTEEVSKEPVNLARKFLRLGEYTTPEGEEIKATEGYKLATQGVKDLDVDPLQLRGMTSPTGLDPQIVAEMFGYQYGGNLLQELLDQPTMKEKIDALTDQRMVEEHSDLATEEDMKKAVDKAIHNEVRARMMATGLKMLTKSPLSVSQITKAAKAAAASRIGKMKVRDLRPGQYDRAEAKANKEALKLAAKDPVGAAAQQQAALLNNQLAKSAREAIEKVEKHVNHVKKLEGKSTLKSLEAGYLEQIFDLLGPFRFKKGETLKAIDKKRTLQQWMDEQVLEFGFQPVLDTELIASVKTMSYKEMTVAQLDGLMEAVAHIEHLGRLKKRLLNARDQREFDKIVADMISSIDANTTRTSKDVATDSSKLGEAAQLARGLIAMHRKFSSLAREMDGGKDGGIMQQYFSRGMNESGAEEAEMKGHATEALAKLFGMFEPDAVVGNLFAKRRMVPGTNLSMTQENRIMFAMNWGNLGNRQRLLSGGLVGDRAMTEETAAKILDTITKEQWDFVQGVLDYFGTYRDQMGALEKDLTGVTPTWVEAEPMVTKFGIYPGGYFPAKYDPRLSSRSEMLEALNATRGSMQGVLGNAHTRDSAVQKRADEVHNQPILLNYNVIASHVSEVTHRLAWERFLVDARRLLRSIEPTVRAHYGPDLYNEMKETLNDIAIGDLPATSSIEKVINHFRVGSTIVGMGWKVFTALLQPSGVTQSIERVGAKWIALGQKRFMTNPIAANDFVNSMSKMMVHRAATMQREVSEVLNVVRGDKQLGNVKASYFTMIAKMQRLVDIPTWLGAYEKGLDQLGYDKANNEEERKVIEDTAVSLADQAVLDSQSGGQIKDLARIQRGTAFWKTMTNFYSYFSATYNLNVENYWRTDFKSPSHMMDYAGSVMILNILPVLYSVALRESLKPECEWDLECLTHAAANEGVSYIFGQLLPLRELTVGVNTLYNELNDEPSHFDWRGPTGLRIFADFAKFSKQAGQVIKDGGETDVAFWKSAANFIGTALHLPLGQVATTGHGIWSLYTGETDPSDAVPVLLVGPPYKK